MTAIAGNVRTENKITSKPKKPFMSNIGALLTHIDTMISSAQTLEEIEKWMDIRNKAIEAYNPSNEMISITEECGRTNTETKLYGLPSDKLIQQLNTYRLKKQLGA